MISNRPFSRRLTQISHDHAPSISEKQHVAHRLSIVHKIGKRVGQDNGVLLRKIPNRGYNGISGQTAQFSFKYKECSLVDGFSIFNSHSLVHKQIFGYFEQRLSSIG